jgi:hypothetical protein
MLRTLGQVESEICAKLRYFGGLYGLSEEKVIDALVGFVEDSMRRWPNRPVDLHEDLIVDWINCMKPEMPTDCAQVLVEVVEAAFASFRRFQNPPESSECGGLTESTL